ncbi:MAG: TatD family deoxyribonuclease [Moraxellaceae bacterium]|nr:MAG: TatD family deoxyribonuclease [Moraxellaceae bacterium]
MPALIDTHTHFDVADFDPDRLAVAMQAKQNGVQALLLIGFVAKRFDALVRVQQQLNQHSTTTPKVLLAPGLHPFYIQQHQPDDLHQLEQFINTHPSIAIGEIGLDTFTAEMKQPDVFARQQAFFSAQLELARQFNLPVLLHIRRAHADTLAILKKHRFSHGGIAHAFGGGIEEAKALIKLGFKLGITGQVTNPNAKRLHQVIREVGAAHLVIETDCPDMTPLCCQLSTEHRTRNTPANLPFVLDGLSQILNVDREKLAEQLWQNSLESLNLNWNY